MRRNYRRCQISHAFVIEGLRPIEELTTEELLKNTRTPSKSKKNPSCVPFCRQFQNYKVTDKRGSANGIKIIPKDAACPHIPGKNCAANAWYLYTDFGHVFYPESDSEMERLLEHFGERLHNPNYGAETPEFQKLYTLNQLLKELQVKTNEK